MKKLSSSLAIILSITALTSGVILTTTPSAHACVLGKGKGLLTGASGNSPTQPSTQVQPKDTNSNPLGIIGGGLAAIVGLLVVGSVAYKACRAGEEANKFLAELPQDGSWDATSWSMPIPLEELCESTTEPETAESKPEKDLTLVG